jgi:hypothetical protein
VNLNCLFLPHFTAPVKVLSAHIWHTAESDGMAESDGYSHNTLVKIRCLILHWIRCLEHRQIIVLIRYRFGAFIYILHMCGMY